MSSFARSTGRFAEESSVATGRVAIGRLRAVFAPLLLVAVTAGCLFQDTAGPLIFEPAQLPEGHLGKAYEAPITIRDNVTPVLAFNVKAGELPPGLRLEVAYQSETGFIRGVPEEAGTYAFTVWVACYGTQVSGQTGTHAYTIVVT